MYLTITVPVYSFAYFAPTIIKTYGYTTVETQLHTVPPIAAALGLTLIMAYLSDRINLRTPFIAFGIALGIIGCAILINIHHSFGPEYLGICFMAMAGFATGPIIVCWYVMNLRGHTERSIGSAWQIGFGNAGGIIATFTFLSKDAPLYHTGYSINIGSVCICALASTLYGFLIWKENRTLKSVSGDGEAEERHYSY